MHTHLVSRSARADEHLLPMPQDKGVTKLGEFEEDVS